MTDHLPAVRRLRDENGWGSKKIGKALGISDDAALRILRKLKLEDAQAISQSFATIQPLARVRAPAFLKTASDYAQAIAECWQQSVEAVIETGRLLCAAKDALDHGEFQPMIEQNLPFGTRTANKLMAIARDDRLQKGLTVSHLPPSWGTLYEITKLDDPTLEARIADGTIRPDMERRDIATAVKATRRAARESHLGDMQAADNLKLPDKRYGVILADPEWRFEPWSRETGLDRSPDNHYPTSVTEVIAARPVQDIAAKDCALFLWATVPMLPHALAVMAAWGFDYRTHIVWKKDKLGTGYWFRNLHELLLLGIRGNVPAPAPGDQWGSILEAAVGEHSEKPSCFHALVEAYFPHLPKIELNARRAREGWDSWGLDAPTPAMACRLPGTP
jgi:N6-adenosine-specific RNA methylase IME4